LVDDNDEETWFFWNEALDAYIEEDVDPDEATSITWTNQGYRYLGVNSSTGACTLYPD
jgi:hypothetical protein